MSCTFHPTFDDPHCNACQFNAIQQMNAQQANYGGNTVFGINGLTPPYAQQVNPQDEKDFHMWKEYAHLSESETIEKFYAECDKIEEIYNDNLRKMEEDKKTVLANFLKLFIDWCAKYRKNLTEKRIKEMKAYL